MKDKNKHKPEEPKSIYVRVLKKYCWLLIGMVPTLIIIALLLYKPAGYIPADKTDVHKQPEQLSTNLTNRLMPEFYNGVQRSEPFEMTIREKDINELIAQSEWPRNSDGFAFYAPKAILAPDTISMMSTVVKSGIELVLTISAEPAFNEDGLLSFNIDKVKIGAMNITPLAAIVAKKTYEQTRPDVVRPDDISALIAGSIFENKPFEPIFRVRGRNVRLENIKIDSEELTVRFLPIPD
ncbi:hypothetical protein ACFL1G_11700 [Planctomycetota bacterium]